MESDNTRMRWVESDNVQWEPITSGLTYSMGRQSFMLDGYSIDLFDLPPNVRLCRATPAAPLIPDDVAATIAEVLTEQIEIYNHHQRYAPLIARLQAALQWLESQRPQARPAQEPPAP